MTTHTNWPISLEVECQTWVQKVWGLQTSKSVNLLASL